MDAKSLLGFIMIAGLIYFIAKVLISLSNTWVGDFLLGSGAGYRKKNGYRRVLYSGNDDLNDANHMSKLGVGPMTFRADDDY